jgi:Prion-inhibition and propagation
MANPIIGGLGHVGLVSLFQTCSVAYDVFVRSAQNLGKDYYRISVLLGVERQKLRLWGQYLGISPSQQCRLLLAETIETQKTVVMMLESIKALLDDIRVIMIRYDVQIEEASQDGTDTTIDLNLEGLDLQDLRNCPAVKLAHTRRRETERSVKSSTSRLRKIKWALTDNAKLSKLVDDLRLINENLWVCLPANKWLALAKGLPSVVLPEIHDRSMLGKVELDAQESRTTKLLAACADLRRAALLSSNDLSPSFGEELRWLSTCVQPSKSLNSGDPKLANQRHIASVKGADDSTRSVILEWRYVDRDFSEEQKQVCRSRIKALAVLLSSSKSSELGLLKCIGFFKDDQPVIERYGLLLEVPSLQNQQPAQIPTSLDHQKNRLYSPHEYIDATTKTPPLLGDRFRIASALCNIVLQIHASNWLHKAICSSNVVFLDKTLESSNADDHMIQPFLVGFDFSRPDRLSADSLEEPRDDSGNTYRHPNLWPSQSAGQRPRFRKEYDIFSLGVVLLEIGNWKLADRSCASRDLESPEAWKAFLLKCTKPLGYRCGRIYQEVVETCFSGPFFESDIAGMQQEHGLDVLDIKRSFLFDVVYQLAKCYA